MSASDFAKMKELERRVAALESLMEVLRQGMDNKAMSSPSPKTLSLKKAS